MGPTGGKVGQSLDLMSGSMLGTGNTGRVINLGVARCLIDGGYTLSPVLVQNYSLR